MFGGFGLYLDEAMFALIDRDALYIKVDDATKEHFAKAGGKAFTYSTRDGQRMVMSYWSPPADAVGDPAKLVPWASLGVEAARRARAKKSRPGDKKKRSPAARS
ncbi:MAG: TfoX family protein [Alphaproteobacteria bacterium]|nr:TfoX family protein [Alphaproteobacteria bacterium]